MRLLLFIIILSAHELVFAISTAGYSIENCDSLEEGHAPYYLVCSSGVNPDLCPGQLLIFILFYNQKAHAFSGSASEVRDKVKETIHIEKLDNLACPTKQPKPYYLPVEIPHNILTTLKNNNAHPAITEQHKFFSNLANYQTQNTRTIIYHLTD